MSTYNVYIMTACSHWLRVSHTQANRFICTQNLWYYKGAMAARCRWTVTWTTSFYYSTVRQFIKIILNIVILTVIITDLNVQGLGYRSCISDPYPAVRRLSLCEKMYILRAIYGFQTCTKPISWVGLYVYDSNWSWRWRCRRRKEFYGGTPDIQVLI